MYIFALLLVSSVGSIYSSDSGDIDWTVSEEKMQMVENIKKVSDGTGHGHGFSDFTEINPVVYVDESSEDKKYEFYFFEGKLYKVYTIFRDQNDVNNFYTKKLIEKKKALGDPTKVYQDELYSMPIQHSVWDTEEETLDIRLGAGYVYEVRTFKPVAIQKQRSIDLKHAI